MTNNEFIETLAHILECYDISEQDDGYDYTVTLINKSNIAVAKATRSSSEEALKACLIKVRAFKASDFR